MGRLINQRNVDFSVDPIFPNRWSPRAMSGEEISDDEFMSLVEAARWAPSSYNNQSWRFVFAKRNTEHWDVLFNLLGEPNKVWCKNAAVLIVIVSKDSFDFNGKPSITHSFDAGAAWENLSLQGTIMDLVVHGMQGFDYVNAKKFLNIPDGFTVEAMAAIGRPGKKNDLPLQLQDKEFPSDRKKLSEIVFEGVFKNG
jgi:nitroreductase